MSINKIKPSILPGFMELLPGEQEKFDDIVNKILTVNKSNGCQLIDTPIIEKADVLLAKTGGETEKQVYSFQKGKNDLALRFDLTVPFARYAAQYYNELIFPFKRCQIGKVYRGERNQKGRYREFYQCDVDIIGKNKLDINNDAWVISLASKAFKAIGLENYKFQISNRKILLGILKEIEIDGSKEVMILIDKYDKIGKDAFLKELSEMIGEDKSQYLNKILEFDGDSCEVLEKLNNLDIKNDDFLMGLDELKKVKRVLAILGVEESEYIVNLKIIRGLDYYTGTVFETLLIGNEVYGSICSGGRYDNLAENYTDNVLPGVGISIGITRLFFVLKEIGFINKYSVKSNVDYLLLPVGDTLEYCGAVYKKLEESGYGVSIYLEDESLKKKMNYANKLGVENVILIGEEEAMQKKIKIKNMCSGKEIMMNFKEL